MQIINKNIYIIDGKSKKEIMCAGCLRQLVRELERDISLCFRSDKRSPFPILIFTNYAKQDAKLKRKINKLTELEIVIGEFYSDVTSGRAKALEGRELLKQQVLLLS